MVAIALSFLKTHWQTALLASLVISVAGAFSFQRHEIRHLGRQLLECHDENNTLEASNKALLASIEDQNKAIASLEALAQSRKNASARSVSRAVAHSAAYGLVAKRIKTQAPSKGECATLRKLVNDFVKGP